MKKHSTYTLFFWLMALTSLALIATGCWSSESAETTSVDAPATSAILAPATDQTKVLLGSSIQVQSTHTQADVTKVELWVQNANELEEQLISAGEPYNGYVLQKWTPQHAGQYTLKVRAWNGADEPQADLIRSVEVVESLAISAGEGLPTNEPSHLGEVAGFGATLQITPTVSAQTEENQASIASEVQITANVVPGPTAVPSYPPPPASPGVPPGPTQAELNNFGPPVCTAAEYLGVYTADTGKRVMITEPDDRPAKSVGGTIVHRAWRIRNIGTCTWGPGYELAFYGGRAMGSGGVAFDDTWPSEPPRRNTVLDTDRLVVPEGKPNQEAILEVKLQTPTTPGIHQSYWRMRDPHGVYFGPIIGVTLEVVRECDFGIYGAPVINRFRILAAGKVYNPQDQTKVTVETGATVQLDWDIINAEKFDVVLESPTGEFQTSSTSNTTDRATFIVEELGSYKISLYADNGSCTVKQQVEVEAIPPYEEQFVMGVVVPSSSSLSGSAGSAGVATSSSLDPNQMQVNWYHYDNNVNDFVLYTQIYTEESVTPECLVDVQSMNLQMFCSGSKKWVLAEEFQKGISSEGGQANSATVSNLTQSVCSRYPDRRYQLRYTMRAGVDGQLANPPQSNTVVVEGLCAGSLPGTELQ